MSLKLKLAIASAGSLVLVAAFCLLFLKGRGSPERRPAPAPPAPTERKVSPGAGTAVKRAPPGVARPVPANAAARASAVEPAPAEGGWRIRGRILSGDPRAGSAAPAEGVIVHLKAQPRRTKLADGPSRKVVTGANGRFDLEHVPGKRWMRIEIDEPSSAYRRLSFHLDEPRDSASCDLGDIFLEPATRLTVQLIGPTGEPAPGGRVLVGRNASMRSQVLASLGIDESRLEAEESEPGTHVLERAAPGSHYIQATAAGCSEGREDVELPREKPLVMRLREGYRIAGTVVAADGMAIAEAELEVLSGPGARELAPRTTSDAAGRFVFDTLAQGEYVIGVRADGFANARRRNISSGTEDLEVVLEAEAVFAGNVVGEVDGRAVARAEVTLRDLDGQLLSESSDDRGVFRVRGIGAGTYTVIARHPEFAPASEGPIEIHQGERIEGRVIRLPVGIVAGGKVVESESGEPVAEAQVTFTARGPAGGAKSATTNAEGAFEVKGLAEGDFEVIASARGHLPGKLEKVVVTRESARDSVITLERGGSISGRVLNPEGKPVVDAIVQPGISYTPSEWNASFESLSTASVQVDSEGRYRLEALQPHRSYLVRASSASFAPASVEGISVGRRGDVEGVDLTLMRGGAIRGRVADAKGIPIVGAKVLAKEETAEDGPMIYPDAEGTGGSTTTATEGTYTLSPLKAGVYTVTSRAKGYSTSKLEKVKVAEGRTVENIDLLLAAGEVLAGRVVDGDESGIAGAAVIVGGAVQAEARTNTEGEFRIGGLRAGGATLHVHKVGFEESNLEVTVPDPEVNVKLQRLAKIAGKLQAKDRDSFPSFQLVAMPQGDGPPGPQSFRDPTQSDPAGTFEIEVGPGTYVLQATVPGFAPSRSEPVTVKAGERRDGVVITLLAGGTVNGVVVARATGTPIEGANVRSRGDEVQPWHGFSAAAATTGPDGSFTLQGVPESFTLIASHERYAQTVITNLVVPPGKSTSVRVELGSGGALRGSVTSGGAPVPGARVRVSKQRAIEPVGKQTTTDASGRFELAGLPAGEYLLIISGLKSTLARRAVVVTDGEVVEVDMAVGTGLRLFGRVTCGGAPAAGGGITAVQPEKARASGAQSPIDASGGYSLELPAPGTYRITVEMAGPGGGRSRARVDVTLPEGVAEYRQDIDVPGGGLSGVVVDADTGEPIRGAQVMAYAGQAGPIAFISLGANLRGWAQAGDAGRFHIAGLEPGAYSLRASADGYADGGVEDARVEAEGGRPETAIALARGITFGARIVDERGQPVVQATAFLGDQDGGVVRAGEPARSLADGRLELSGVRPGTYRLIIVHRAYAPARVTVRAAAGAEPTVTLRPGGKLHVIVSTRQGSPVEGAVIELTGEDGENLLEALLYLRLLGGGAPLESKADGSIILEQVPAGTHRIAASKEAVRSGEERIQVKAGETTEVLLTLE